MNSFTKLLTLVCSFFVSNTVSAQISGTVFKDFNFNGTQQPTGFPTEPGVYGITVKAYNSANAQVGPTKTTAVNGTYSFSAAEIGAGTAVRIEFTVPDGTFNAKRANAGNNPNGTDVQFATAPSAAINYAIANQDWYSNTANPYVATNGATNGNPTGGGTAGTNNNLYIFPYSMRDAGNTTFDDGGATRRRPNSELGSVFGLTFQKSTRTLIMSAYLKRHIGFGPNGMGAIYKSTVDATGVPAAAALLVNVSAIGINVGTDPRTVALPAASNTRNADVGVFSEVGKRGIGGIDVSEDGKDLYLVNMFEKKLHRINIGSPLKTTFAAADVTGTWTITDPATAGLTWRPMACKTANGKVYVGGVVVREKTTNHNLAADTVGARGIVYEFDPVTGNFTEVLRYGLNYRRGFSNNEYRYPNKCNWWCGWQNNGGGLATDPMRADYNNANPPANDFTGGIYYPQPMMSNIEFDVDGSMILGIRDRFGDQIGYQNLADDGQPIVAFSGGYFRGLTSGEVLRAGKNLAGSAFTLEARGQVTSNGVTTGTLDAAAAGNPAVGGSWSVPAPSPWGGFYGPGWGGTAGAIPPGGPNPGTQGGYFYFNHNFTTTGTGTNGVGAATTLNGTAGAAINAHYMKSDGGLALLAGSNEVIHTLMDPVNTAFANGASRMINSGANAGNMAQRLQLVATTTGNPGDPTNSGKSNGLGDLEILTDYQPIEIGNRIWNDANSNGIQDAGETTAGVPAGTTVTLRSPGVNGIYGDGDDQTTTTTTDAAGNYYFSSFGASDNRKPASFIGIGANDILPGFDYRIEVAIPSNLQLTIANTAANSLDNIDNDGVTNGANAVVTFNTANNNHSYDFGFKSLASIGDKVWLDNGSGANAGNGVQDAGEPGVAGVTVTLRDNAGNVLATTVTDSYGNYLFDNLIPGNYTVTVTPPANYTFTTQTNTVDNTAGTAPLATGSDVNVTTGQSYVINLVAGENERNIDAGLVFSQPVAASLGDKVWFDNGAGGGTGGNGIQDGAEPGVAGVTVTLYASNGTTVLATTVTDANGNYRFNNLTAGIQYIVGFTPPAGFIFTGKDLGGNDNTDSDVNTTAGATFGKTDLLAALTAGENRTSVDAGLVQQPATAASVGDRVWNDLDQDGIQDAGEPGVAGVTVTLYQNGTAIATTVTDAFGNYIFNNLPAGTGYQVGITLPTGYTLSPSDQGTDNKLDNDIQTILGNRTPLFPLTAGLRNLTLDAGIYQTTPAGTAKLGDKVWFDANGNGVQDGGNEAGVPGVTVELLNGSGASIDPDGAGPLTRTLAVTDANGNYQFVNLAAGSYIVAFSNIPAGYNFTQQVTPGDNGNNTNSDANLLTGRSSVIALTAAESDQTIDAGLVAGTSSGLGSLGNKIWYDLNSNGLQDAGELGVAGVIVTLLDAGPDGIVGNGDDGASRTAVTNALGEYLFTGLPAGNYVVQFGTAALPLPVGFTVTGQNTGANDNIDSDGGAIAAGGAPAGSSRTGVISLTAGEDNLTVDLGLIAPANTNTLGDKVWADNGAGGGTAIDGVQNGTEPGIAGLTVTLYDNAGTAIATTTTDVNGQYLFAGLGNGNYSVGFANLPAGFSFTTADTDGVPGNGTLDSDADRITGRTATVTLNGANRNDRTLDAGLVSTRAALGNFVWYDTNGDGDQDAGEAGVPGVTVSLYFDANNDGDFLDAGENVPASSMITDQSGGYFFSNLLPGNYQVGFTTIPAGVNFTTQDAGGNDSLDSDVTPATGRTATVNLSPGEVDLTVDAGLFRPQATVGNFIWVDNGAGGGTSGNGVQDGTEPGLPGVLVTLFDAGTNLPIATTVTDGNGGYIFNNVPPGTYYLQIGNLPSGATISPQDAGGNDNTDNDFNPGTSRTANFVVPPTAVNLSFDGGVLTDLSALPVRITEFTAIKKNSIAELNWKVEAETALSGYAVERSADGRNFVTIATLAATGASNYRSTDAQPLKGLNYYRLKIVNLDGSIEYSEVRIVVFGSKGTISVFPNPSVDRVNILLPESWQGKAVTIDIMDQLGRVVIKISGTQAGQVETINVSKLPAAAYLLRMINSEGKQEVRKIQVKK
jgi:SdrD B-like domain/Secretion system C-terminal sorting domain